MAKNIVTCSILASDPIQQNQVRGRKKVNEDAALRTEQSGERAWMFLSRGTEGACGSAISRGFPSVHRCAAKKLISFVVY